MAISIATNNYRNNYYIPVGYKFHPTEEELIDLYLVRKNRGQRLPCDTVKEYDLYGMEEPWEIWNKFEGGRVSVDDQEVFFFTKLKSKNTSKIRIDRRVASGTWKGESNAQILRVRDHKTCIGLKSKFKYINDKSEQNSKWLMHEYSLKKKAAQEDVSLFF
jgi:hypothetical protein